MNTIRTITAAAGIATLLTLSACGTTDMRQSNTSQASYPTTTNQQVQYGVVQSMEMVRPEANTGIGAGTIVGAVVGGVLGNQVGKGGGNTAATVLGAAGGAYAGHQIEKNNRGQTADAVQLTVRLNDGSRVTLTQAAGEDIRVGDRVVVADGTARRY
ncbi:MAG: glycine zipper 2TM domain-containing protein [Betaproteobacteria bacterium]